MLRTPTDTCTVAPTARAHGRISVPGDKSISHRYAMLAALAEGTSKLGNFSRGADCASTLACMRALGAEWTRLEDGTVEQKGTGGTLRRPAVPLDCGNSGSTMRMLSGILAGQPFTTELFGDPSLSRRPMMRVVEPLTKMGATIKANDGGRPPLRITGSEKLRPIDYVTPVPSAQVKSSVLFAGLFADGETSVTESVRTRDHGELALRAFGAEVHREKNRTTIRGGQQLHAIEAFVPGDISSAAFFLCAAAISPGSNLVIEGLGMNPTRAALLDVLIGIGAKISVIHLEEHGGELVGTVKVEHGVLRGATIRGALSAQLIDELPVLAAMAPFTEQGIEIRDAKELRVKESDRIAAVAANLRAMGAEVQELEDGMIVRGGQSLHGAVIDSQDDHRIAMAFAIAALRAEDETEITGANAADISFPEFWDLLDRVSEPSV